ncbi:hypothetical protein OJAV_G00004700 [Oryzias javanicus]|uniref:CCHC NOA-type domain-containing protein n=1 Tax=Oryzias javanicus TaxID=123683 RepID=A0A437DM32_ORYJA|nr:hypothetical protein OJAV_G00004700 [Oryzias javanicus]
MDNDSVKADIDVAKEKTRSFSVLNTLYHEKRQEIELLHKQINVKDNIIADLKARLGRYERIYMTVGDNEPVLVGPSNSLVESLVKEIIKVKQKRKDTDLKAARQAEEIQRLNVLLREKELELERVRCQPDHEKDQEIQRLRTSLADKERTEATRSILCTSLAEEADQLRGQLGATVKVCQELLGRLEEKKEARGLVEEMPQQQKAKEPSELSDSTSIKSQIRQLQEENQQLKQRVEYVQGLNSQWQKYDSSREDYIRGLSRAYFSRRFLASTLLEEKIQECVRLDREVEEVRRQNQERVQTLEQQVLIYEEDFKSERADRERAQGQIEDLKEQISQLKQQLHKQQGATRESRDVVPLCRVHIGHRISSKRNKDSPEPLLRSSAERQQAPAAAVAKPSAAWMNPGLSELQCPQCLARFNDMDAAEYLNHCEECARL